MTPFRLLLLGCFGALQRMNRSICDVFSVDMNGSWIGAIGGRTHFTEFFRIFIAAARVVAYSLSTHIIIATQHRLGKSAIQLRGSHHKIRLHDNSLTCEMHVDILSMKWAVDENRLHKGYHLCRM